MKKLLSVFLISAISLALLSGCSVKTNEKNKSDYEYKVAVAQFAEHASLDNCVDGFVQGLASEGFVAGKNLYIEVMNAQADGSIANQIAESIVNDDNDLICAVATPMAQSAYNSADGKDMPVIYTAVNDPVLAKLANEDGTPVGNATGTSDKLPVEAQLKTIRAFLPEAKKIGILYSTSEINSESTIAEYKALADKYGFEIVDSGISSSADIPLALDSLLTKVDCISNLTDNTVVNSLDVMLDKANAKNIPVFGSEVEQVKKGCIASAGIDYVELGKQTGRMAARVLSGEDISNIPFEIITETNLYINQSVIDKFGLQCPEEFKDTAIQVQ